MSAYWGVIIAAAGLFVSALGFLAGRKSAAKGEGKHEGEVLTKLDSISDSIDKIDVRLGNMETQMGEQRDRLTKLETKVEIYHGGDSNT